VIATFYYSGYSPVLERYYYHVLCDNGVAFDTVEYEYVGKTGLRLVLPDEWCMPESGWVYWGCDECGVQFWTRTFPGGKVTCPSCGRIDTCPEDAIMMEYEGQTEVEEDELS